MKRRDSVDAITLVLSIVMGVELIIGGLYMGLLVWPFYSNGLHMQPADKVLSGSFEPQGLAPFCYTPPDVPSWWATRCADGVEGNPWGEVLLGGAMLTALLGPMLLILLGFLVGVFLIKVWSALWFSARVIGLLDVMLCLGLLGFLWVNHLGQLLLVWIMD